VPGGHDVQDSGAADPGGVVEAHPVHDPCATVVSDRGEGVEAETRHRRDLVRGHGSFAVLGVVGAGGRFRGTAIAAQIRQHDGVALGQDRGDLMPHHMRLRIAVQQQDRWSGAGCAAGDADPVDVHLDRCEPREQLCHVAHSRLGGVRRAPGVPTLCCLLSVQSLTIIVPWFSPRISARNASRMRAPALRARR
jgi:hypothetical protein